MHLTRRTLLATAAAGASGVAPSAARAAVIIRTLPRDDLASEKYRLANSIFYDSSSREAIPSEGLPASALRLSDDVVFDGAGHMLMCREGPGAGSLDSVINLYRSDRGRSSERVLIENLRFGFTRYGIITPFEADRPAASLGPPPAHVWFDRGEHVVRRVFGHAYERAIRIAARNTLIEDFNLFNVGGTIAEPTMFKRAIAITLKGPNPVVRRGIIRGLVHIPNDALPAGTIQEAVGISLEADCDGALIEDVEIGNAVALPHLSIGLWIGNSENVTVRNLTVRNLEFAIGASAASGLIENSHSFNCVHGFAQIASHPGFKLRSVHDHKLVDGVWQTTDVSNI